MKARTLRRVAKAVAFDPRLHAALARPRVCQVMTPALRPLARWLPRPLLFGMPVQRRFRVAVPGSPCGFLARVDAEDRIAKALFWYGFAGHEPQTARLLASLAATSGTFLDVGANTGVYSLLVAAANARIAVHAFEPAPAVFDRLRLNVELNRFSHLHPHQLAVSDHSGTARLHLPDDDRGVPTEASLLRGFRPSAGSVEVAVTSVDDFVEEWSLPRVDLMKVDTEGTARMVVEGAVRTLSNDRPLLVCEILHAVKSDTDAGTLLRDLDYIPFLITASGLVRETMADGDPTYRNMNYLFAHRESLGELRSLVPTG